MISYDVTDFDQPLVRHERATPRPVGDQVLVRIEAAGVCHSDLHIWHGSYDLGHGKKLSMADRGLKLPLTMGHEIAGEVIAVGDAVRGVTVGKRYLVFPWHGCGECSVCQRGDENLCLAGKSMGVFQPGGYADHVLVSHARYLVDIGDMPPVQAAPVAGLVPSARHQVPWVASTIDNWSTFWKRATLRTPTRSLKSCSNAPVSMSTSISWVSMLW